jgi:hypothetical protein
MTFLMKTQTGTARADLYTRALGEWERAAKVVGQLWAEYRVAGRELQPIAFRAYVAALDSEEAAAHALRALAPAQPKAA